MSRYSILKAHFHQQGPNPECKIPHLCFSPLTLVGSFVSRIAWSRSVVHDKTHQVSVGLLPQHSAERHHGTDDSKEDEENGSQALQLECIGDVTQIVRIAVLYIVHETAKYSASNNNSLSSSLSAFSSTCISCSLFHSTLNIILQFLLTAEFSSLTALKRP